MPYSFLFYLTAWYTQRNGEHGESCPPQFCTPSQKVTNLPNFQPSKLDHQDLERSWCPK